MEIFATKDYGILAKLNEGVQNLHAELFPEFFKVHNLAEMTEFFKSVVDKPEHHFFIVKDVEELIGYAWIEVKDIPEGPIKKAFRLGYVHQISINEEKRNKGYGSFLIHKIASFARDHNLSRIELDYWIDNKNARSFYEKLGFVKFREHVYMDV
ncbi:MULTISPECIES: GNAT family N-acetyltransferase [unclassified Bacillus (in: firmicutes)]|uniref:GNAT family N-acetyltransferase n=1 Tax=unclassified Bacillus (in: firmicutes) TaxID=185979 RepID=UPI000BF092F3|nr:MULTISPECIES: GNAT family N-acetyltransferase [unclassified Bacillus (in: firmicutes)]PEJ57906.1 GNAT family N-acetyltransferase [Bacillus sp. AFS002410]PEL12523.1 GNAT family N-acetyltransferase [Bacillus sp. AFS017336]